MKVLKEEKIPFKKISDKAIVIDCIYYFVPTTGYFRYVDGRASYFKGPDRGIYNLLRRRERDKKEIEAKGQKP